MATSCSKERLSLSTLAQDCQGARVQGATRAEYAGATNQHRTDQWQYQQPWMRVPGQVEGVAVKHQADQLRTQGCEQAADGAEQAELDASGLDQQLALGPQCAQQRTLANTFIQGCLQAGEQHGHARRQHE